MEFPANQKYTKDHEWVRVESKNVVIIGITDYAQGELGELVYVEVESIGEQLAQNETFGTVEAVKTTSELFMPVSGKVLEFNEKLSESGGDNPTLINEDPYNEGWIVKVEMSDPSQFEALMDAEAYKELVG